MKAGKHKGEEDDKEPALSMENENTFSYFFDTIDRFFIH